MQHTQNYQLPTWEKDDRIMMEDFNGMTEKIDAGMERAQSTADTAQQTALTHKNYASGTYEGNDSNLTVTLGFRPSVVLITRRIDEAGKNDNHATLFFVDGQPSPFFEFLDDGFRVSHSTSLAPYPYFSGPGKHYLYLALR